MSGWRSLGPLAAKDARILRRSPLLVGLLVIYPLAVALLLGLALSRGPAEPKVALVNQVAAADSTVDLGGETLDARTYALRLMKNTRPVSVATREQALRMVRDGDVVGAIVIPPKTVEQLRGVLSLNGERRLPTIEVLTNDADPVRASALRELIQARLADANAEIGKRLIGVGGSYLGVLLNGGNLRLLGLSGDILGLRQASEILKRAAAELPRGGTRGDVERVGRFAQLAVDNLAFAVPILDSIADPIRIHRTSVTGPAVSLDVYAAAVAVAVSLLLVATLLGAGLVALEREERTFGRLVRAAVRPGVLLGSKTLLAGATGAVVGLLVAGGLALFLGLDPARIPLWLVAAAAAGVACGALGVALGALAPEVRAASLLAILLLVPVVVIGLVPEGTVSSLVGTVIDVVSGAFPFRPGLRLVTAALEHGAFWGPLLHLLLLAVAWSAVARVAIVRSGARG
ncbi:ABC transporter permease [Patulibacter defluvii]|uniref:ABC transporter permease n=1 Tax=Patulibacter defluvii TaxID=3095358 RepID=UPI002A75FE91|nr:ABC transporter permease [Patulibacter sp. DM4]